jgi:ArsR family transcriptional regulator, arsenate/arsenite/antimonite-responsive transcriptional repressor
MNMGSYSCCDSNDKKLKDISYLSTFLTLISEECRLKILCILEKRTHCVCELMGHTKQSQSLISHHLKDLKDAGLISDEKKGMWVYYSLTNKGKTITNILLNFSTKETFR